MIFSIKMQSSSSSEDSGDDITKGIDYYNPHISREQIYSMINLRPINLFHYRQAFVHRSIQKNIKLHPNCLEYMKHSYERYEFLGDSILNMIIAEYLFNKYPDEDEGFLTKIRTKIVNGKNLSYFAKKLNLGQFILMGNNVEKIKGRENDRILEDVFESLVCAIYLDLGIEKTKVFILKLIKDYINFDELLIDDNYKDILLRFCQNKLNTTPSYSVIETMGPPHNREFVVITIIQNIKYKIGKGKSKKIAEQISAMETLKHFSVIQI